MKTKKILIVIATLFIQFTIFGQTGTLDSLGNIDPRRAEIKLIARADNDSVVLRWAPNTAGGWSIANKIGYIIERISITETGELDPANYIVLTEKPVKPWTLEEWEQYSPRDNKFAAISAQALYGKAFIPSALDEGNINALKNAADELMNRYSFSLFCADNDPLAAIGLGLRLTDKNVEKGKQYAYRVYTAQITNDYAFDTAYCFVETSGYQKFPAPAELNFESGEKRIVLRWNHNLGIEFSGYYIYRSEDGVNFTQLNETPLIFPTPIGAINEATPRFDDTTVINYKNYFYKVFGVTPFGELSEHAEITAFAKDLTGPPTPYVFEPEQISQTQVKIRWKMETTSPDLEGFIIARSSDSHLGFTPLFDKPLSKNTFEYIDDLTGQFEAYYIIAALDTAGNVSPSLPVMAIIVDTISPSIPTGLAGIIDTNGVVRLSWNLGPESNIVGYRVLRANDISHEFTQLTGKPHIDTTYIDTVNINTLTRHIYYRIAAVNHRFQHSEMSDVLILKRPDIIPPEPSVIRDVFVTDTSVAIEWAVSGSEDLALQKLYRRIMGENSWHEIASVPRHINYYVDKEVETNKIYEYIIIAIDSSGLNSIPSMIIQGRPYDTGKRNPVLNLRALYNKSKEEVELKWDYVPNFKERYWFLIYRGTQNQSFAEYKAIEAKDNLFADKYIYNDGLYKYGVKVMTSMGGESEMIYTEINITK